MRMGLNIRNAMGKPYYDTEDINNYMTWEKDVVSGKNLREKYGIVTMHHTCSYVEDKFSVKCPACKQKLSGKFGHYNKPLEETFIECAIGKPEDGHGWWARVIHLVLN
jgi:hypothetical protein